MYSILYFLKNIMREHLEPLLSVCTHGVYTLCVHTVCTQTGVYTHTLVWYRTGTCDTCDTSTWRWYRNRASGAAALKLRSPI